MFVLFNKQPKCASIDQPTKLIKRWHGSINACSRGCYSQCAPLVFAAMIVSLWHLRALKDKELAWFARLR